ncbi:MAG: hypothetical protein HYX87_03190 [Chloroflexi bacterium]|nr:hypothetical protein [Chloroflexota bacterium]
MKEVLSWLAIFFAGMIAGLMGSLPVFATGLFVHELVANTLGLGMAAACVTLGSGWAGNAMYRATRTRLVAVLGVCEALGAFLAAIYLVLLAAAVHVEIVPFAALVAMVAVLAAGGCLGTLFLRGPRRKPGRDIVLSVAMLLVSAVSVILVLYIASLFGLVGA